MDIAKMSTLMSQANIKMEASLAVMGHTKNIAEQQGEQFIKMLKQSTEGTIPHPSLGNKIDLSI